MADEPVVQQQEEDEEPSAPFWMVTFSDMSTLLLTFFVLIVSMSTIEVEKFKEALSYFTGYTGVLSQVSPIPKKNIKIPKSKLRSKEQAKRYEQVLKYIKEKGLEDKVQLNLTEEGLHAIITDSVMFRSGEAELIPSAKIILEMISGIIAEDVQSVVVEGHTDNRPIHTSKFPSNWELSAARASSVVRFLLQLSHALPPERYVAAGFGEFHPIDTNETPEGRARNRRVEILFSWEKWPTTTNSPFLLKRLRAAR